MMSDALPTARNQAAGHAAIATFNLTQWSKVGIAENGVALVILQDRNPEVAIQRNPSRALHAKGLATFGQKSRFMRR
jgi:hypothetical protein